MQEDFTFVTGEEDKDKIISKSINKLSFRLFVIGCIVSICLGAIVQNFYKVIPKTIGIELFFRYVWFGPVWWVWLLPIPVVVYVAYKIIKNTKVKLNDNNGVHRT